MNKQEARRLVLVLFSGYASQMSFIKPDDAKMMIETYVGGFEDLAADDLKAAIARAHKLSVKLPSIAEIRSLVIESSGVAGAKRRTGVEAWGEVIGAIGKYGRDRVPGVSFSFSDPIVDHIVYSLGWRELCDSENQTADRARFIEAYEKSSLMQRREAAAGHGARTLQIPARTSGTHKLVDALANVTKALPVGGGSRDDDDSTKG
jgi:hypothetical protein